MSFSLFTLFFALYFYLLTVLANISRLAAVSPCLQKDQGKEDTGAVSHALSILFHCECNRLLLMEHHESCKFSLHVPALHAALTLALPCTCSISLALCKKRHCVYRSFYMWSILYIETARCSIRHAHRCSKRPASLGSPPLAVAHSYPCRFSPRRRKSSTLILYLPFSEPSLPLADNPSVALSPYLRDDIF